MAVDGKKSDQSFGFRFGPKSLTLIDMLVEGKQTIYIDAVRVLESWR